MENQNIDNHSPSIAFTVFHISSKNLPLSFVESVTSKYTSILEWAWICHDRDVYTEADKEKSPDCIIGEPKPTHYHLIIRSKEKINIDQLSRWFGIPYSEIEKPQHGGKRGFIIQVVYITHMSEKQRNLGKFQYPVEEIKSNIDIKSRIEKFSSKSNKEDRKQFIRYIRSNVHNLKLSLEDVKRIDYNYWVDHIESLTCLRDKGEKEMQKKIKESIKSRHPKTRISIYVMGQSGVGKSVFCRTLAYLLYPELRNNENELMFFTSDGGSTFQEYNYQPVIIWDEVRSRELIKNIGSRAVFLKIFDPHPIMDCRDIKYGDITLVNSYNLVNSSIDYRNFISEIWIEGEDKNQFYRRFPIIVGIEKDRIVIFVSRRFIDHSCDFSSLQEYHVINGCFTNLINAVSPTEEKNEFLDICQKIFSPLLGLIKKIDNSSFIESEDKKFLKDKVLKEFGIK